MAEIEPICVPVEDMFDAASLLPFFVEVLLADAVGVDVGARGVVETVVADLVGVTVAALVVVLLVAFWLLPAEFLLCSKLQYVYFMSLV